MISVRLGGEETSRFPEPANWMDGQATLQLTSNKPGLAVLPLQVKALQDGADIMQYAASCTKFLHV
jgi:hypothetical protein